MAAKDDAVQLMIQLGHTCRMREKRTLEGFTHDWSVFVRGDANHDISHCVQKVVFNLHPEFKNPKRVVKKPPFEVQESGYGSFFMNIDIHFKNVREPKRHTFEYDLALCDSKAPLSFFRPERLVFKNPVEEFRDKLIKSGGVPVCCRDEGERMKKGGKTVRSQAGNVREKGAGNSERTKTPDEGPKKADGKQMPGATQPKPPNSGDSFTAIFGEPLMASAMQPKKAQKPKKEHPKVKKQTLTGDTNQEDPAGAKKEEKRKPSGGIMAQPDLKNAEKKKPPTSAGSKKEDGKDNGKKKLLPPPDPKKEDETKKSPADAKKEDDKNVEKRKSLAGVLVPTLKKLKPAVGKNDEPVEEQKGEEKAAGISKKKRKQARKKKKKAEEKAKADEQPLQLSPVSSLSEVWSSSDFGSPPLKKANKEETRKEVIPAELLFSPVSPLSETPFSFGMESPLKALPTIGQKKSVKAAGESIPEIAIAADGESQMQVVPEVTKKVIQQEEAINSPEEKVEKLKPGSSAEVEKKAEEEKADAEQTKSANADEVKKRKRARKKARKAEEKAKKDEDIAEKKLEEEKAAAERKKQEEAKRLVRQQEEEERLKRIEEKARKAAAAERRRAAEKAKEKAASFHDEPEYFHLESPPYGAAGCSSVIFPVESIPFAGERQLHPIPVAAVAPILRTAPTFTSNGLEEEDDIEQAKLEVEDDLIRKCLTMSPKYRKRLVKLSDIISGLSRKGDYDTLQKIVDVIEESGQYRVSRENFHFNLLFFDDAIIQKIDFLLTGKKRGAC